MWPFDTPPSGWLVCNGDDIPAGTEYDALRSLFSSNGKVPDFRGYFPRGKSDSRDLLTTEGDATKMPNNPFGTSSSGNHSHTFPVYRSNGANNSWGNWNGAATDPQHYGNPSTHAAGSHTHSITGGDSETRPINIAVNFIIKY